VAEARRDVETLMKEAVAWAEGPDAVTLSEAEAGLWARMLAVGRSLVALYLVARASRPRAATYEHDGRTFELRGQRTSDVGTRFGKVSFTRAIGRQVGKSRARRDLPIDREVGLGCGFSLSMVMIVTRFCTQMAFAQARLTFQDVYGWAPASRSVLRMVDTVGALGRGFLDQVGAPADDGEVLVLQADGKGAPMISSAEIGKRRQSRRRDTDVNKRRQRHKRRRDVPKRRKKKGDKSKNAKMAVIGVIYTMRRLPDGSLEGPINKKVIATFGGHEALFIWLRKEADKRGYGTKPTLFLGDGARVLWRLKEQYFPLADGCLDWYHTAEKLWTCGEAVEPKNEAARALWVATQTKLLRKHGAGPVITNLGTAYNAIPKTGPGTKARRKKLLKVRHHLLRHMNHLRYPDLRRRDLEIGTGVVEGAVRNVIGVRLDGPGMRWSVARAERLMQLRCILINGQWAEFERYVAERSSECVVRLPARPVPTVTHDAPRKLAA
jgi:hypothetical protein